MGESSPANEMKILPIVLLGCGGVGQQLISHILHTRPLHAAQGVHISVQAVCDSNSLAVSKGGQVAELSDAVLNRIQSTKALKLPLSSLPPSEEYIMNALQTDFKIRNLMEHLEHCSSSTGLIVVDCTASEETALLLSRAADLYHCIVLANKKPLTSSLDIYDRLCKRRRYLRYESTVGAGLPVIATLTRFLMAGDPVHRIVGALSGTLGYVMSSLQEGQPFSVVVQRAKSLGYTEPDPRDDLSGMDVARKALILARLMGWSINMEDIAVESLFPVQMEQSRMSMEQFLTEGLSSLDAVMNDRINSAKTGGNVLRYVATIGEGRCKVGIVEVACDSPLGQLKGSDNLIEIYSRCYKSSPFVIQGAGAGNDTTACGVLADILDLQDLF
eukprot:c12202_g1_i1 orf=281-1441(-)